MDTMNNFKNKFSTSSSNSITRCTRCGRLYTKDSYVPLICITCRRELYEGD